MSGNQFHCKNNSYNKSAVIDKTIKRKLNKSLLHTVFDPSNVGIPWPVMSASVGTPWPVSVSTVGIPGPVSVMGIHGPARMGFPEPVRMGIPEPVCVGVPEPVSTVLLDRLKLKSLQ